MLGRILRSADFERVLGSSACARSPHFAVHFVAGQPSRPAGKRATEEGPERVDSRELSTTDAPVSAQPVDELPAPAVKTRSANEPQVWLGTVVPKRHAKRAVTRNLLKRQIHAALARRDVPGQARLSSGLWVVRLRAPFDRLAFASAASRALREAACAEIDALLAQAVQRLGGDAAPAPRNR